MSIIDRNLNGFNGVELRNTNVLHMNKEGQTSLGRTAQGHQDFGSLLMSKLDDVNAAQSEVNALSELMVTNPDAVDTHDITIAMAKAEMSMNLTKAVVDKAVQAYKDIVNMR